MSIAAFEQAAARARGLQGQTCTRARALLVADYLWLDFGPHRAARHRRARRGDDEPAATLSTPRPWRIETAAAVLAGSADPIEVKQAAAWRLIGQRLDEVEVFRPSFTLRLAFAGGETVWCFPHDGKDFAPDEPHCNWRVSGYTYPDWSAR